MLVSSAYMAFALVALALMVAELFLPGGVVFALGFAILPVLALHHLGLLTTTTGLLGSWVFLSAGMAVGAQVAIRRYFPPEVANQESDEDLDAYGRMVEVLEEVTPDAETGRIRYQGTSWGATSLDRALRPGEKARLVSREGLVWVVEPVDEDGDGVADLYLPEPEPPGPRKNKKRN